MPRNSMRKHTVTTLLSQFLGMDIEKYVTNPMMSLLFTLSTFPINSEDPNQSVDVSCLKFDEFLDENIHSPQVYFPRTITFRFQSYLLRMFCLSMKETYSFWKWWSQSKSTMITLNSWTFWWHKYIVPSSRKRYPGCYLRWRKPWNPPLIRGLEIGSCQKKV